MQSAQAIGFHESSIIGIRREGLMITLELEGVHFGDQVCSAVIRMTDVQTLTRDGIEVEDLALECTDGEVLTLRYTKNTLHLIVEWNDFKKHQSQTHSYQVIFGSIEVSTR